MNSVGNLHLIIGPMYAGKSTELIRMINRFKFLNYKILCINHSINSRYGSNNIITHDKDEIKDCVSMTNLEEIDSCDMYKYADVIIIEEVQFFKDAYDKIKRMIDIDNKKVVAAGLISDFNREPFGDVLRLIPISDTIQHVTALCSKCKDGTPAPFTKRQTNDKQKELVGSYGIYEAVCRYHYLYD
jgi:thymidine kinase